MMRKINKRISKRFGNKSYAIVADGKTEAWYFQMMKQEENILVNIVPELPDHKSLDALFDIVKNKSKEGYDKVYWIVDFDTFIKEDRECKKGKSSSLAKFNEYYKELKKRPNVEVLINDPCLEFWYLQHFTYCGRYYPTYNKLIKDLKKFMNDYEKTEKYYKQTNNIYKRLHPNLTKAIDNAKQLSKYNPDNPETPQAEIHKLVELLLKEKQDK